jgi:hypothetical protein
LEREWLPFTKFNGGKNMSVAPDMLQQFGGVPVGSDHRFEGWWGAKTFFVDYDYGSAGANGDSMNAPTKHLRVAIANASEGDTIYMRPRDYASGTYGEDPQVIQPDTAANWTTIAKPNLSIIGTGKGMGHASAHKCWVQGYSGVATGIINLYSPGCVVENLRFQLNTSNIAHIYSQNSGTTNYNGGNETIINNDFHDGSSTAPAVKLDSTWQMSIVGNRFLNCDMGIYVKSLYSVPQIFHVWDNQFIITGAELYSDLYADGGIKRFLAYRNYHAAVQPSGGGQSKYYSFGATSTGAIEGCVFAAADTTDTNLFTLNGVVQSGNFSSLGLVIT